MIYIIISLTSCITRADSIRYRMFCPMYKVRRGPDLTCLTMGLDSILRQHKKYRQLIQKMWSFNQIIKQ